MSEGTATEPSPPEPSAPAAEEPANTTIEKPQAKLEGRSKTNSTIEKPQAEGDPEDSIIKKSQAEPE